MKIIVLIFIAFYVQFALLGQTQNYTRKLLYTLQKNEIISSNEALICLKNNSSNFCLIIDDTLQKNSFFILNGKKIYTEKTESFITIEEINLDSLFYYFRFWKEKDNYLNFNGKIIGPYEFIIPMFCKESNENGYLYKLGSKFYLNIQNKKYGPFINPHDCIYMSNTNKYFSYYRNNSINYSAVVSGQDILELNGNKITLNGKIIHEELEGTFSNLSFESLNNFCYIFQKGYNSPYKYICRNGDEGIINNFNYYNFFYLNNSDIYYSTSEWHGTDLGYLTSIFRNKSKIFTNIDLIAAYNHRNVFLYQDENHNIYLNNQKIINLDGATLIDPVVESEKSYAFAYEKGGYFFVKSSNGEFGPYETIEGLNLSEGELCFTYRLDNIIYSYRNGIIKANENVIIGFGYETENLSLTLRNHYFETSYDYDFVVIDGDSYGTSPALQSWIEPSTSSFKWTALENNEYVLYTFPIK